VEVRKYQPKDFDQVYLKAYSSFSLILRTILDKVRQIFRDGLSELWVAAYLLNWERPLSSSQACHGSLVAVGCLLFFYRPFAATLYLATYLFAITSAYKYFFGIYVK